jgi:hypothetical protein
MRWMKKSVGNCHGKCYRSAEDMGLMPDRIICLGIHFPKAEVHEDVWKDT